MKMINEELLDDLVDLLRIDTKYKQYLPYLFEVQNSDTFSIDAEGNVIKWTKMTWLLKNEQK